MSFPGVMDNASCGGRNHDLIHTHYSSALIDKHNQSMRKTSPHYHISKESEDLSSHGIEWIFDEPRTARAYNLICEIPE